MKVYTESLFKLPEVEVVDTADVRSDCLVVGVFEGELRKSKWLGKIGRAFPVFDMLGKVGFEGKVRQVAFFTPQGLSYPRLVVVGLGRRSEKEHIKKENIRRASALACTRARSEKARSLTLAGFEGHEREALEGAFLGLYSFRKYKRKPDEEDDVPRGDIEKIYLVSQSKRKAEKIAEYTRILCEAQNFARDIVNEPGNVINPLTLSEIASALSEKYGLRCEIFDAEEIRRMGMGGVIAVGQGSATPPKFVHMSFIPEKPKEKIALIGKAITFDTGGISLKSQAHIVTMKLDKAGACAVLGAMKVIAQIKPDVEVHGIFAACENMPSGTAQRPDDIIRIMDGQTVEVVNTDAEGRLTLADALVFAGRLGVSRIIDLATLTGACMVALGEFTAGVMGNSRDFIDLVVSTGRELGEKMWELPLDRDLEDKLKSDFADMKNVGDGYGGAITAGIFLSKFVKKGIDWVHMDIAGPAFVNKKIAYFTVKGGTGFGVRTLVELVKKIEKGEK